MTVADICTNYLSERLFNTLFIEETNRKRKTKPN